MENTDKFQSPAESIICEHWSKMWRTGGSNGIIKISLGWKKSYTNTEQTETVTVGNCSAAEMTELHL